VRVGTEPERTFTISEDLITSASDFFRNALRPDGCWKESRDKEIRLQDEDPNVFAKYIQLLYTGYAPIKQPTTARPEDDDENKDLARLYVMAHKFQDINCQNVIVSTFLIKARTPTARKRCCVHNFPDVEAINIIYNGTGGSCAARRLVADLRGEALIMYGADWLNRCKEELPKDFVLDLAVAMKEWMEKRREDWVLNCDPALYHEGKGKKTWLPRSRSKSEDSDIEDEDEDEVAIFDDVDV
jgi:hypothetical protein